MARYVLLNDVQINVPGSGVYMFRAGRVIDEAVSSVTVAQLVAAGGTLMPETDPKALALEAAVSRAKLRGGQRTDPNVPSLEDSSITGPVTSVATLAVLSTTPGQTVGQRMFVQTVRSFFEWSGTAWLRGRGGNDYWRAQSAWFVNPTLGDDEAAGTSLAPLRTVKELMYRLGGVIVQMTWLTIVGDLPASDPLGQLTLRVEWDPAKAPALPPWIASGTSPALVVSGTPVTSRTSTATAAATAPVPASNLASSFTDSTVSSWAAEVGSMIVVTSGPALGAFCFVAKDLGGGVARTSRWASAFGTNAATLPGAGDSYRVVSMSQLGDETLPTLTVGTSSVLPSAELQLAYFRFVTGHPMVAGSGAIFRTRFMGCQFDTTSSIGYGAGSGVVLSQCYFAAAILANMGATLEFLGTLHAGNVSFTGARCDVFSDVLVQGARVLLDQMSFANAASVGIFDAAQPVNVGHASTLVLNTALYGSGNSGMGLSIIRGGRVGFYADFTPTLATSSGNEITFDSLTMAFPPVRSGGVVPSPALCNTFALWAAAPFFRTALGMASGAATYSGSAPATIVAAQTSGTVTVASIAALTALPNPGASFVLAYVTSNKSYWVWDSAQSSTSDGVLYQSAASGSGRWVRLRIGSEAYRTTGAFFVDPTSGSDEAAGTSSGTAIKTIKELALRLGDTLARTVTVTLLNDLPSTDSLGQLSFLARFDNSGSAPAIAVVGQRTNTATGTVASAAVQSTNVASQVSDSGVANWTSLVGTQLKPTSGSATGSVAWILKDLGAGVARVSRWKSAGNAAKTSTLPVATDTYAVQAMTKVTGSGLPSLTCNGSNGTGVISFQNIDFQSTVTARGPCGVQYGFYDCKFSSTLNVRGCEVAAAGCYFAGLVTLSGSGAFGNGLNTCAFAAGLTVQQGASAVLVDSTSQGATGYVVQEGAYASMTDCCAYDATTALQVINAKVNFPATWYGSGSTTGTLVKKNGGIRTSGGSTPTCAATTELSFESASTAISPLVAGAAVPAASSMDTWAKWAAAPFSKAVVSYASGSYIITA